MTVAQLAHLRPLGRTFDAPVGAKIVVMAVAIALAVGFVVASNIAGEVGQGGAVVAGDQVDAGLVNNSNQRETSTNVFINRTLGVSYSGQSKVSLPRIPSFGINWEF